MATILQTSEKRILSVRDVENDNKDSIGREISSLERLIATGKMFGKKNFSGCIHYMVLYQ